MKNIINVFGKRKNILLLFLYCIIFFQSLQIIYLQRRFFQEIYDVSYWKDRFEHSQWILPLSKRIIGDDGLFSYIGYSLINGGSLAGFNAETPPLGKYLIGLSIVIFKNPAYYAFFFGIGSLFLFYLISKKLLNTNLLALFAVLLLFVEPLFINQFWRAWVDIVQLFFILANLLLFLLSIYSKSRNALAFLFLSGVSLGLFTEIKPPILTPIILFLESAFFIYKKRIKECFILVIGLFIGVMVCYSRFFLDGNSFLEFLKLKKYVIDFYLKSQVIVHKEAIWQTLFLGKFPNIANGFLTSVSEWWIMWPPVSGIGILASLIFIFKKNTTLIWKGLSIFVLSTLVIYTLIPAYPRYLIIILPFFYLFFVKMITLFASHRVSIFIFLTILIYGTIHTTMFLQDKPEIILNNFYYNLSHQYFQDIFQENISLKNKSLMSRDKFRLLAQYALDQATIKKIEIKEVGREIERFKNVGKVKIVVLYKTENLGWFEENKEIKLTKEDGAWKIVWNWDLVVNGFLPGYNIVTIESQGKRGRILNSKGNVLAEDSKGYLVTVNPEEIDLQKENDMLSFLSKVGQVKNVHLQNAYLENSISGSYVPLFTLFTDLTDDLKNKILSFRGIKIIPHTSRIYKTTAIDPLSVGNVFYEECCTRIYSSYNYHGIEGIEEQYDRMLSGHDGGSINIEDKNGNIVKTVLSKLKKDGQDIIYD